MRDEHVIIAGTCPAGAPFRHVAPGAPCVMECVGTTIIKVERVRHAVSVTPMIGDRADNADHDGTVLVLADDGVGRAPPVRGRVGGAEHMAGAGAVRDPGSWWRPVRTVPRVGRRRRDELEPGHAGVARLAWQPHARGGDVGITCPCHPAGPSCS